MNIPVLVLLGFAAWTLIILSVGVGGYRWALILSGRASVAEWRADAPQGADWYQRVTRAHMNCIENLPVYGAVVVALTVVGLQSRFIDGLSEAMLTRRQLDRGRRQQAAIGSQPRVEARGDQANRDPRRSGISCHS